MNLPQTDTMMKNAIVEGVFPSASLLVAKNKKIVFQGYYGACNESTIFDVASLTKPVVTTTLAMKAVSEGLISLEDKVGRYLPTAPYMENVSIFHLLNHTSGLPHWQPYYQEIPLHEIASVDARKYVLDAVSMEPLMDEIGTRSVYSDLGFILLGELLEDVFYEPIHSLANEVIFKKLGMQNSFFRLITETPFSDEHFESAYVGDEEDYANFAFAPTEDCPWRGRVIQGYVHDQNCYAMGGVAGHAGLFSNVMDINIFVEELVKSLIEQSNFIEKDIIERFICLNLSYVQPEYKGDFVLGWDRPSKKNSQAGRMFSSNTIGHLAYTGCSLWIDLERDLWIILLSNRLYPSSTNEKIKGFRSKIHDKILQELDV